MESPTVIKHKQTRILIEGYKINLKKGMDIYAAVRRYTSIELAEILEYLLTKKPK